MQKIATCLWFDNQAEEAVNFYTKIFANSKVGDVLYYDKDSAQASGIAEGSVLTIDFEIEGREMMALNGGPLFKFNESVSLVINCKNQEEVDYYWNKLTADGGQESACGWLKDKFGMSWQVTPVVLPEMLKDKDPAKAQRAMKSMLQMKKIDIKALEKAYNNE